MWGDLERNFNRKLWSDQSDREHQKGSTGKHKLGGAAAIKRGGSSNRELSALKDELPLDTERRLVLLQLAFPCGRDDN